MSAHLRASPCRRETQGNGWDEPCKARALRTVLWAAGGEIPPADPATGSPRTKPGLWSVRADLYESSASIWTPPCCASAISVLARVVRGCRSVSGLWCRSSVLLAPMEFAGLPPHSSRGLLSPHAHSGLTSPGFGPVCHHFDCPCEPARLGRISDILSRLRRKMSVSRGVVAS